MWLNHYTFSSFLTKAQKSVSSFMFSLNFCTVVVNAVVVNKTKHATAGEHEKDFSLAS